MMQALAAVWSRIEHLWPSSGDFMAYTPAFGSSEWKKYLDIDVEDITPPETLVSYLEKPCPFWGGKKVRETHQLCLIPKGLYLELFWRKVTGQTLRPAVEEVKKVEPPYWILITKEIVPGSRDAHCELVNNSKARGYERPTALEAAVAVYVVRMMTNQEIYNRSGTRCLEEYLGYPVNILSSHHCTIDMSIQDWGGVHGEALVLSPLNNL